MHRLSRALLLALLAVIPSPSAPGDDAVALAPVETVATGFQALRGIAVDAGGQPVVADRDAGTVTRITADGRRLVLASGLERPVGVAFDLAGRLLVVEERAGRVTRLEPDGRRVTVLAGIELPRWIAVADTGTLYVSARRATRGPDPVPDNESAEPQAVLAFTTAGALRVLIDELQHVQGLAVGDGAVYAATEGRLRAPADGVVMRIPLLAEDRAGPVTAVSVAGTLKQPLGIAQDALGAIFVTAREVRTGGARWSQPVAKIGSDGRPTPFVAPLQDPKGLAFDGSGHLYVADGRRVLRFRAPAAPTLSGLPAFTSRADVSVTGTAAPGARVDFFIDETRSPVTASPGPAGVFSAVLTLTPEATHTVEVFVTTHAGAGLTGLPATAVVVHDGTAPTVTFASPPGAAVVRGVVGVQARATDGGSGLTGLALHAEGLALAAALTPTPPAPALTADASWDTATVSDGMHILRANATDRAGNTRTVTRVVTVDNTPPDTTIVGGPAGETGESTATFTFTGADNLTPTEGLVFAWRLDSGPLSAFSAAANATVADLAEGAHVFEVTARDLAGNPDPTPARRAFTVTPAPSIVSLTPASAPVGTLVTIAGARFDPAATQVAVSGVPARVTSLSPTKITTIVPIGAATGALTVTTSRGTASAPFTVVTTSDFALTALPAHATVLPGGAVTYSVRVDGTPGFAGLVQLAVSGGRPDLDVTISPRTLGPGEIGTVTVTTGAASAPGSVPLSVVGTTTVDGGAATRTQSVVVEVAAGGVTALAGRVLDTNAAPVAGVTLSLDGRSTTTDAAGNFLLWPVIAGPDRFLFIEGSTAVPDRKYPSFPVLLRIDAGRVNTLPFTPFLHAQNTERFTPIVAGAETVVTDPALPGFEMRIPADVTIVGWDGQPNTKVSVRTVPLDRMPLPPPDPPLAARSVYMFYFDKVGGGVPTRPVPVSALNDLGLAPGEPAELWYYDEGPTPASAAHRWLMAGTATVGEDGATIRTDPGVGLPRFCCGAFLFAAKTGVSTTATSLTRDGVRGGEPVDLATGLFVLDRTDLVVAGRLPVLPTRTYRTGDGAVGPFGRGTSAFFTASVLHPTPTTLVYVEPGNTRTTFTKDADGAFRTATVPGLRGAAFVANVDGTLTLRLRDGGTRVFEPTFEANRFQLRSVADRVGRRITLARDSLGRPVGLIGAGGRRLELEFSGLRTVVDAMTDPLGRRVQYGYDAALRLTSVTDAAGGLTGYTYDDRDRLTSITDARGHVALRNEYAPSGRVVGQVQADGGRWSFAYLLSGATVAGPGCPGAGCPRTESAEAVAGGHAFDGGYVLATTVTDPRGHTTIYRFNNFGHVVERIDALGRSTRFERAEGSNLLLSLTDPLGRVTRFTYDAAGNVTSVTDATGGVRRYSYETAFNGLTSVTDALGGVTSLDYDAGGNLTAAVDPLGSRTTIVYDATGQPTGVTDTLGNTTSLAYDAFGNLATITDPLGHARTFVYDAGSRVVSDTDARGKTTTFTYDALDRVTRVVDALAGTTDIAYDANGNVVGITDARGSITQFAYDAMDRMVTRTDPLGAVETFAYDARGNPVRHADRLGRVSTFAYDARDRRTDAVYPDSTVNTVYDAAGRISRAADSLGGVILYGYDGLDRLIAETSDLGTVAYVHDALGRRQSMTVSGHDPVTYDFDAASRLTAVGRGAQRLLLQHDAAGRRSRLTLPNEVSVDYRWDASSRLTALIYANRSGALGDLAYEYDAAGNPVAVAGSLARTRLPDPVATSSYDAAHRLLAFGDRQLSYDANGNAISISEPTGSSSLTWDTRNRLVALTTAGGTFRWLHDAESRRIVTRKDDDEVHHLYDGYDVVQSSALTGATTFLRTLALDEVVARDASEYYVTDALGSTLAVTDAAGSIATRYTYEPFGRTLAEGVESANAFQFTGREHDVGTGLYGYRMRPYSPILHRFLSEDPLGWLAGPNPYAYAANRPTLLKDPFGLDLIVALYFGANGNPFGHIGVAVYNPQFRTVGFNPLPAPQFDYGAVALLPVPGFAGADVNQLRDLVRIPTTRAADQLAQQAINERIANPGVYHLIARNCTMFVAAVLQRAGIQVPNRVFPERLMELLRQAYGQGDL